ncbi:hypothetical protein AMECASPLE_024050 [Ameca splendens]|uniref:Uncharacterized protein n=1 Tax=Ameca splendens TaxID=208324 RepID=A0ABV0Z3F2_9TELE
MISVEIKAKRMATVSHLTSQHCRDTTSTKSVCVPNPVITSYCQSSDTIGAKGPPRTTLILRPPTLFSRRMKASFSISDFFLATSSMAPKYMKRFSRVEHSSVIATIFSEISDTTLLVPIIT